MAIGDKLVSQRNLAYNFTHLLVLQFTSYLSGDRAKMRVFFPRLIGSRELINQTKSMDWCDGGGVAL